MAENCPTIDFNSLTCGAFGATSTYEVNNYDLIGKIEWTVEGGEIVQVGDWAIGSFAQSYCSSTMDWSLAINFTSISYNKSNSGSATFYNTSTNTTETLSQDGGSLPFNINYARKIVIVWHNNGGPKKLKVRGEGLGFLGLCGHSETTKDITVTPYVSNSFSLTASQTNLFCNQGVQISGAPSGGVSYDWNTHGGVIQNYWNGGIYISNFTRDGAVPISVTVSNACNSVTKTVTLNVIQPDFGHVTQSGTNVDVPGSLVEIDCQGNFYLGMPWVSNNAIYTWELPGSYYDNQTAVYDKTIISGVNKINVQGKLPAGGLTDFVGKVTITGVCGAPVVRTFIIRPTLAPSVDADIYSCSNSVLIKVNNPDGGTNNINAWVASSTPAGGWGSFVNPTPTSVQFTASSAGDFVININIYGVRGCYTQLQTTVHAVSAGQNTSAGTAGWQSGVLSDNRKAPGSNIVAYGGNIYFTGRDGIIYYYNYSTALQKWVINQIPGISNAAVPVAGSFNKIGIATLGGDTYLFYTDNTGLFKKINLATNFVDDGIGRVLSATDLVATGSDLYVIEKTSNILYYNASLTPYTLTNSSLKTIVPGNGVVYIQNNNLFTTAMGQLTSTNDIYASSDVVVFNGWIYFARGQKGHANLYRLSMSSPSAIEQITTASNLSGVFTINPASGVIYYGILDAGLNNTTYTVASGNYVSANIYQAHLSGTAWIFNAATLVKPREGLDMYIQSPVYAGNHLYYIGAGHNNAIGDGYELEVWNLYYENACAPAVQRVGANLDEASGNTEALLYPNPFNTELSIDVSNYTEDGNKTSVSIEVIDAAGKSIYKANVLSELHSISTSAWASGMYVVRITHNNTTINKKIVKY